MVNKKLRLVCCSIYIGKGNRDLVVNFTPPIFKGDYGNDSIPLLWGHCAGKKNDEDRPGRSALTLTSGDLIVNAHGGFGYNDNYKRLMGYNNSNMGEAIHYISGTFYLPPENWI
jgi:hypothetical protein